MVTIFLLISRYFCDCQSLTYLQGHAPSQALLSICHMEGRGLPVEHNVACVFSTNVINCFLLR
jgi:hypothetical protein